MLADTARRKPPVRRPRRGPADHLRDALVRLGGGHPQVLRHSERAWASVTFAGTRHSLALVFHGAEAVAAGEAFIDALPEHEFAIPGQLVADATVSSVHHVMHPAPRMIVTATLLLLEDA